MEKHNFNMLIAGTTFIIGGLFVLSDGAGITANLIGDTASTYSLASFMGLIIIILSMTFFILVANLKSRQPEGLDRAALERLVHENPKNHTEIHSEMTRQDIEQRHKEAPKHVLDEKP